MVRNRLVRHAILLLLLVAGYGCNMARDEKPAQPTAAGGEQKLAKITALPNPVPAAASAVANISWDTGDNTPAEVYVALDQEQEEKLFAAGPFGQKEVDWITAGHTFHFRLYAGSEHAKLLAQVDVTRAGE